MTTVRPALALANIGRAAGLAVLLFLSLVASLLAPAEAKMRADRLSLVTGTGEHEIEIEVAETIEEKSLGLMFRAELPPGRGMLFPYPAPHEVTMWMKNTYIPLDMVFIRADGTVHRVEERAEPQSERIISSNGLVTAVLEIAGGEGRRFGVKPGDKVRHPHFKTGAR